MKTQGSIYARLRIAGLVAWSLGSIVGCEESVVSPHSDGRVSNVTEEVFTVPEGAVVEVEDFVGQVTWRTGGAGAVHVKATRRAASREDLESIEVEMRSWSGGVDILARNPMELHDAAVDLEITAPEGTMPRVSTAVGSIDYRGRPRGRCRFSTGVGSIRLRLPVDVDVSVELRATVGSIFSAFPIDGSISTPPGVVHGRIGRGDGAELEASSAVGSIHLMHW